MTDELKAANKLVEKVIERTQGYSVASVERGETSHPADINVTGHNGALGCMFDAWLPLLAIRELTNWCSPDIADMTDYPCMAAEGDWSGVRDTDRTRILEIFDAHVAPQLA